MELDTEAHPPHHTTENVNNIWQEMQAARTFV